MTRTQHFASLSRRPADGASGAWWFVRWLLVWVVAFDFLSAPFHHHHHDGVEGQLQFATGHASFHDSGAHADSDDHPLVSHATMAIRVEPSRLGQLPAIDNLDAQVALVSVAQRITGVVELLPEDWRLDRSRPDLPSHRSLPPAGRAPPPHA